MSKPTFIRFNLENNEDEDLVCFLCGGPRCEQRFPVTGGGQGKLLGIHNACVDKHMGKLSHLPATEATG